MKKTILLTVFASLTLPALTSLAAADGCRLEFDGPTVAVCVSAQATGVGPKSFSICHKERAQKAKDYVVIGKNLLQRNLDVLENTPHLFLVLNPNYTSRNEIVRDVAFSDKASYPIVLAREIEPEPFARTYVAAVGLSRDLKKAVLKTGLKSTEFYTCQEVNNKFK